MLSNILYFACFSFDVNVDFIIFGSEKMKIGFEFHIFCQIDVFCIYRPHLNETIISKCLSPKAFFSSLLSDFIYILEEGIGGKTGEAKYHKNTKLQSSIQWLKCSLAKPTNCREGRVGSKEIFNKWVLQAIFCDNGYYVKYFEIH